MSIRHAAQPQFPLRGLREGPAAPWVRPDDWPTLPWIVETAQAFVGLIAVHDTDNERVALRCQGNYTVEWGDGTAPENFASNVVASHKYNFATLGTLLTSRGYKTAVVKAYPQAGQNLTLISLQEVSPESSASLPAAAWLDIQINAALASTILIGQQSLRLYELERVHIRNHALTSTTRLFNKLFSLMSVPLFDTSGVTDSSLMFYQNWALNELPLFDLSNVINAEQMINGCQSLSVIPAFDLSSATNVLGFAYQCFSLYRWPAVTLGAAVNATQMVDQTQSLKEIAPADWSGVNNLTGAFGLNYSLSRIQATGIKVTFSIAGGNMSAMALNELFTNLATVVGQTVTITGNPGAGTCDQSIATAKGWTVVN